MCAAFLWRCLLMVSFTGSAFSAGSLNAEGELIRQLTDPSVYEKVVRPVRNISDPVVVTVKFTVQRFQLDSSTSTLSLYGYPEIGWKDEYMRWNESEYDGLQSILVPGDAIWLPDIGIYNRIDADPAFEYRPAHRIILKSDGTLTWLLVAAFSVECVMKMAKFPFDEQICSFLIGSLSHDPRKLQLLKNSVPSSTKGTVNGEWSCVENGEVETYYYEQNFPDWKQYRVTMYLRRKSTYYVLNVLIPCVGVSLLVVMVFFLPCESGEQISLSITTLVALTVFQMTTANNIPKTTNETPVLVIYLTALTAMSAASIVLTVLVLKVFYTPADREMSPMVERVIRGLAKITWNTAAIPRNFTSSPTATSVSPMDRSRKA
ncbi:neuronal acetylcholine receptor subunit alpha-6-like isoform X2 [Lineus longissimus]|uniref:neuronal acetylcholine receptor subunit alpha-6-like isoform X2 n=1 Tax=Lineus longissimus TaxID=88925 RepID=UPI002B4D7C1C